MSLFVSGSTSLVAFALFYGSKQSFKYLPKLVEIVNLNITHVKGLICVDVRGRRVGPFLTTVHLKPPLIKADKHQSYCINTLHTCKQCASVFLKPLDMWRLLELWLCRFQRCYGPVQRVSFPIKELPTLADLFFVKILNK